MLTGFNDIVTQSIKLLPILLQAPRLFAGQIKIGDIQQTVLVFVRLQNALSFFRNFYKQFTVYRARLERLYGFMQSMDDDSCTQLPQPDGPCINRLCPELTTKLMFSISFSPSAR